MEQGTAVLGSKSGALPDRKLRRYAYELYLIYEEHIRTNGFWGRYMLPRDPKFHSSTPEFQRHYELSDHLIVKYTLPN